MQSSRHRGVGALVALLGLFAGGCAREGADAPRLLIDGTPARPAPVALEGVDAPAILTTVEAVETGRARERAELRACLALGRRAGSRSPIVVRRGVHGRSVTFRSMTGRSLYACDDTGGGAGDEPPWCGSAFGLFSAHYLAASHLALGCTNPQGEPVGFTWLELTPRSRYLAVWHGRYAEVYETKAALPIRVTTTSVEIETSSASLRVSEHSADGDLIRMYRVDAVVAG